ncbi:alpha/beta hydrolase [Nocardioides bizhenqiangii]|uniref:Alpha/beta-hydrolase family protein n=1 Tax=Nocardioides bizhenqiangii TaxID=3095076 RepID=A0ABZ0ZQP6_9ACTN|nr:MULTISPECIES: alpha/beta-hydrolase family protein [unclassified Nocardioides]MDZ5619895.1 alpha/beta-hydrolase family protein [Nocardioides sp. HM23]WQQ26099.1 alpha/beta-hydrolase family protein [Nocardioides sp. HM61]
MLQVQGWQDRARRLQGRVRLRPAGVALAAVLVCFSLTPSLLPRPPLFQGIVSGVAAATGYGLGVFVAWCWRGLSGRPRRPWPAWARWLLVAGGAAAGLVSLLLGMRWQQEAHRLAGTEPTPVAFVLLTPPIAVLVAALLLALARGIRAATRRVVGLLERRLEPQAATVLGVLLMVLVAWSLVSGVAGDVALRSLDASFAVADRTTPSGVERPTTPLRSGSEESLVEWDDLGREGRTFVGRGPSAEEIEELTDRPAMEPIRTYAGLSSEDDVDDRAALAVADLDRAGGFEREHLLVVTTTGTGWVEPSAASGFEYVTGGDSAIVAMQYSHLASWLSFLVDAARARDAGRALFDAVYGHWSKLPLDERPELYVFGESLGSFGAEEAFSGEFDLANRTSGALFVGPPSFNPLYRAFVDDRSSGSPEIEPVYRGGRIVRFTTDANRSPLDDREWSGGRVLYLQHASDPVTWWSPDLLLTRPDWLEEERGDDVPDSMHWFPIVSFLQVSGDLASAFSTQPAHGHNFSGEHAAAWVTIVQPEQWSDELTERLRVELRRFP